MNRLLTILLIFISPLLMTSQETNNEKYLEKVQTLDGTLQTLYDVISGDAGVKRDWDLFRYLFKEDGKLIPSGKSPLGKFDLRYITPDQYVESSGKWVVQNGFHEREIARKVERFGPIAHVFSTYHAFKNDTDTKPFMRGINSIQLLHDGERWWVVNIYWTQESPDNPIPDKYLASPKN